MMTVCTATAAPEAACAACGGRLVQTTAGRPVGTCAACGGRQTLATVTFQEACSVARLDLPMIEDCPATENQTYFDVTFRDRGEKRRVHGWMSETTRIYQIG